MHGGKGRWFEEEPEENPLIKRGKLAIGASATVLGAAGVVLFGDDLIRDIAVSSSFSLAEHQQVAHTLETVKNTAGTIGSYVIASMGFTLATRQT